MLRLFGVKTHVLKEITTDVNWAEGLLMTLLSKSSYAVAKTPPL